MQACEELLGMLSSSYAQAVMKLHLLNQKRIASSRLGKSSGKEGQSQRQEHWGQPQLVAVTKLSCMCATSRRASSLLQTGT